MGADFNKRPLSNETPDFEFSLGVNFILSEYYANYRPTDAQFSIANNVKIRPGLDIINPQDRDRVLITYGSDHSAETKLSHLLTRKKLGATVLSLVQEFPDKSVIHQNAKIDDELPIQVYQIPSGTRLLGPSIKDPSYNEKYIERICFKLGRIMNNVHNENENLFGISLNSVAVVNGNDSESEDDILFAFVPPLSTQKIMSDINTTTVTNFIPEDYPQNNIDAYIEGLEA